MTMNRAAIGRICALFALMNLKALAGGGASITLQPVPPRTVPPSSYPPGTTIVGQEIILGSVPGRIWLEVHITGWAPSQLQTIQTRIDGAGFLGANSVCLGQPATGADIVPAQVTCENHLQCRNALTGSGLICSELDTAHCHEQSCTHGFEDTCDPRLPSFLVGLHDVGPCFLYPGIPLGLSCYYGGTMNPGEFIPDFQPSYIGTLVVDVPASAKGTYTIDFDEQQTFMQNDAPPGENNIPVSLFPARITVPCGRCCSGYEGDQIVCMDRVAEADCSDVKDQVFSDGELCPESGGPACAECASNVDCDDGVACTTNRCTGAHACEFVPAQAYCSDGLFCNGNEVCNGITGCHPGEPPCAHERCDEVNDECLAGIPTVSNWGLVVFALALLVMAKVKSCDKPSLR